RRLHEVARLTGAASGVPGARAPGTSYNAAFFKGVRMRSILASLGATLLLLAIPVHTDSRRFPPDAASRTVPLAGPHVAPAGRTMLAVVSRANLDEDRWDPELASIAVGSDSSTPKMLTSGRKGISSPRFSPDGSRIAFLMMDGPSKDAHLQVFTMGKGGGD